MAKDRNPRDASNVNSEALAENITPQIMAFRLQSVSKDVGYTGMHDFFQYSYLPILNYQTTGKSKNKCVFFFFWSFFLIDT